ncbi:DUF3574 domain-containing protein [Streptomyces sp. NPDC050856]|uniref:DUF3574 domain-containing protein n=1 Tax=Streptomyces sp. NPDC050856 TaxID=3154939 RepID=UPI0034102547
MTSATSYRLHLATAVAVLLVTAGASAAHTPAEKHPAPASSPRTEPYLKTHLFFGTGRHNGAPPITERQFMQFLAEHITPRFPSGLTIQEGHGQWRDRTGAINSERSYELIVLYPQTEAKARDSDIEYIRERYKRMFGLESVGRADVKAQADF